ncbi:MAG TPA: GNAT family N-acetyltransferase [Candidatus Limnocylindria bacterium]|nr:GNAT family N-acetyltransferase [Candidatus Limnocylindria bacterium]
MTIPTLRGPRVVLRPMTVADLPHLVRWGSEPEFRWQQWGRQPGRFAEADARTWIEFMTRDGESGAWLIEHDSKPIGFANFRDIKPKGASCEIGIGIGEPDLWGQHLGREALRLEVDYLQRALGLHRIGLGVVAHNDRAIWMYKSLGFVVEGIERDGIGREAGFLDDVKMGLVTGKPRPDFDPRPVTLERDHVRLEPLRMEHAAALFAAGDEDDIWLHMIPRPQGLEGYTKYIRWALDQTILGQQLPFAVIRKSDGELVGTTRYAHIDPPNHTIEIGYTWYGKGARRTPINTEAKLLLMTHAFEALKANRLWFQTDKRNVRSQDAIARLGAVKDAELRNERILADGRLRTSVVFSVIAEDWPETKRRLEGFLAK